MRSFDLFGLRIDPVSNNEIRHWLASPRAAPNSRIVFGWSITIIPKLRQWPQLAALTNGFELILAEGKGLHLLCNALGARLPEHTSLPDVVEMALEEANAHLQSVYLLGATIDVNEAACRNVREKYPMLRRIDGRDGYFGLNEEGQILQQIQSANPDLLLIGLPSPRKEELAARLRLQLERATIIPCGGMLDVLGGKTSREPKLVQKLALTWIYRVILEPRRLLKPVLLDGIMFLLGALPVVLVRRFMFRQSSYTFLKFYGH